MRLERRYGYQQILRDIVDGKLSTYVAVIGEFIAHPFLETQVWDAGLDNLKAPLLAFLMQLAGKDDDQEAANDNAPLIPYSTYYERLFGIGTGWLGWSPEITWSATPAEITAAYKGRIAMLRAMLGSPENPNPVSLDDKFKLVFGGMARKVQHAGSVGKGG
jgi:hypothetical protein